MDSLLDKLAENVSNAALCSIFLVVWTVMVTFE